MPNNNVNVIIQIQFFGLFKEEDMRRIVCLLLVAVMSLGLVACGGVSTSDIEGKYDFVKMKEGKSTVTAKELKQDSIENVTLEIKKDGSAVFDMGGEKQKMKFDVDKKTVKVESEVGDFSFDKGVMVISSKDKKNVFTFKKK